MEGVVGDVTQHLGHRELHCGDVGAALLGAAVVDLPRRFEHEQAQHADRGVGVGDLLLHHLVLGDDLAVRLAAQRPLAHHVECQLALRDGAHGVVDASAAEAPLRQHLGAVLWPEQVIEGHAHVAVDDVVVVARLRHDLHTGRLAGHHEHAVGAHHEEDVGDPARAGEPLLAIDDPLFAVANRVGPEEVGIRAALRLGHRVGREHLLVDQRLEPALLLLLGAVGGEHLHVAGVGRSGTEQLRGGG